MRSLQRLAISVAVVLAGIGAVSASGTVDTSAPAGTRPLLAPFAAGSEDTPVILAQQLKAPGTVESRVLKRPPPGLTAKPRDPQALLKEDCTWTNGGVAHCLVWDCDKDGVCVEYGEYCVDGNAHTIPC